MAHDLMKKREASKEPQDNAPSLNKLIQYKFLHDIRNSQAKYVYKQPIVDGSQVPSFYAPPIDVSVKSLPLETLKAVLSSNPYFSEDDWKEGLRLPVGAQIKLTHLG